MYKAYGNQQFVAVLGSFADIRLLYRQPDFAAFVRLGVRRICAAGVYYLAVLYNVIYNIEFFKICEVVLVLDLNGNDTVLCIYLGHCNVDELVCCFHFLELAALFAFW